MVNLFDENGNLLPLNPDPPKKAKPKKATPKIIESSEIFKVGNIVKISEKYLLSITGDECNVFINKAIWEVMSIDSENKTLDVIEDTVKLFNIPFEEVEKAKYS